MEGIKVEIPARGFHDSYVMAILLIEESQTVTAHLVGERPPSTFTIPSEETTGDIGDYLSPEEEMDIGEGLAEVEAGRSRTFNSAEELFGWLGE